MRSKLQLMLFLCIAASLTAQTGGNFDLSHNVIAGGGGRSQAGQLRIEGTVGQPSAGTLSNGGEFSVHGGFWSMVPLVPTAGTALISGRVLAAGGRGLAGAQIRLTNMSTGEIVSTTTNPFGAYRFEDRQVGQTYLVSVTAKRFTFDPNVYVITLNDDVTVEDFVAAP